MATPTVAPSPPSRAEETAHLYRLSVEQYRRMVKTGILAEDDPVELLEGLLIQKMTKNRPHSRATQDLRDRIFVILPAGYYVDSQEPFDAEDSEPEPDLMIVRGKRNDYPDEHPPASAVALVVEVADTSLKTDRERKTRVYARAGILVYWLVNLNARQIEVYGDPSDAAYQVSKTYKAGDVLPLILDGQEIARFAVSDLLP